MNPSSIYIHLPNGDIAALIYSVTVADLVNGLLLLAIVCLQVVQMWRSRLS
jgi:hypothetical protein